MHEKLLETSAQLLAQARDYLAYVTFGGVGGVVYLLLSGRDFCFKSVLKAGFVSGFTGLLTGLLVEYLRLGSPLAYSMAGLAGFGGGVSLIWLISALQKRFGFASEAELSELREDIHRDKPPECSLSSLVVRREITVDDVKDILDGKVGVLTTLVMQGKLDGAVFEEIVRWSNKLNTNARREKTRRGAYRAADE